MRTWALCGWLVCLTVGSATAQTNTPPPSPELRTLLREARQALASRKFDDAAAKYEAALALDPKNTFAQFNLGVVRYQQGQLDEAEAALAKVIAATPDDSGAWSLRGAIHFRQGKLQIALKELRGAVALDPGNAEAHNFLGIALSEHGKPADAEQEVRRAIELKPDYADAHVNLAVLYAHQQPPRRELARYHYQKALALHAPPDPALEALLNPAPTPTNAPAP